MSSALNQDEVKRCPRILIILLTEILNKLYVLGSILVFETVSIVLSIRFFLLFFLERF